MHDSEAAVAAAVAAGLLGESRDAEGVVSAVVDDAKEEAVVSPPEDAWTATAEMKSEAGGTLEGTASTNSFTRSSRSTGSPRGVLMSAKRPTEQGDMPCRAESHV